MRNTFSKLFRDYWPVAARWRRGSGCSRKDLSEARWGKFLGVSPQWALLSTVILLITIGTVMIFSASFFHRSVSGDAYFFLRRQFLWLPIAVLAGMLVCRFDYRILSRFYWQIMAITTFVLILVFIPGIQLILNGAKRWIQVGSMQFQPSEMAKLVVIIFLAGFLANDPTRSVSFLRGFLPAAGWIFVVAGLILVEPDFGTFIFILFLAGSLFMIAGVRWRYAIVSTLFAAGPIAGFMMWRWEQVRPRLLAFVEPEQIYQVKQSLIALGLGGLTGAGPGAGVQKLKFLPEPQTDFIFAVIGEELGFLGSLLIIFLFLAFLFSGIAIARRARDYFGFLLSSGIVIAITLQAAINIAVVTASAPTKGIPLPFITFGGSGLVMTLIQVGLLLSVARISEMDAAPAEALERGGAP